ncbi:MAG: hypothetical protein ACTSQY_00975 [Candidatus Odinarchaeia archaeon]
MDFIMSLLERSIVNALLGSAYCIAGLVEAYRKGETPDMDKFFSTILLAGISGFIVPIENLTVDQQITCVSGITMLIHKGLKALTSKR